MVCQDECYTKAQDKEDIDLILNIQLPKFSKNVVWTIRDEDVKEEANVID